MGKGELGMKLLIQFPTKQRPEKFKKYLLTYLDLLEDKKNYEIHVSCSKEDLTMNNEKMKNLISFFPKVSIDFTDIETKIQACNSGVKEKDWDIVLLASDDMLPVKKGYDNIIREEFKKHFPDGDGVLHFNDGYRGYKLNTLSIMDRKYYDRFGFIYDPVYKSFYSDNEFDSISKELDRKVYLDQVIIKHEHPGNTSEGVRDALHKENHKYVKEDRKTYEQRLKDRRGKGKKIISFSLYGDLSKYCIGAILNAKLQPKIYPGWTCRFYIHKPSVPSDIVKELEGLGCELIFKETNLGTEQGSYGRFWRYEILKDKSVARFIVRDTDSRLSMREKVCVDEWEESETGFHIIRDHKHHGSRIMGGMWGASFKVEVYYDRLLKRFRAKDGNGNGKNQKFLTQMIYPRIKNDVCIHDDRHFFKDEVVRNISHKKVNDSFIGEIIEIWKRKYLYPVVLIYYIVDTCFF